MTTFLPSAVRVLQAKCDANRSERAAIAAQGERLAAAERAVDAVAQRPATLMVPLSGGKALVRATPVRDAPLLALLGDDYFRECTPAQATALLRRRVAAVQAALEQVDARFAELQLELELEHGVGASAADAEHEFVDFAASDALGDEIGGSESAPSDNIVEHDVAYSHPPLPFSPAELAQRRADDAALIARAFDRFRDVDEGDVDVAQLGPLVLPPPPSPLAQAPVAASAAPSPLGDVVVERRAHSTAPVQAAPAAEAAPARVSLFKRSKQK